MEDENVEVWGFLQFSGHKGAECNLPLIHVSTFICNNGCGLLSRLLRQKLYYNLHLILLLKTLFASFSRNRYIVHAPVSLVLYLTLSFT